MTDNVVQFLGGNPAAENIPRQSTASLLGIPTSDVRFFPLDVQLEIMRGSFMQAFHQNPVLTADQKAAWLASNALHLVKLAETIFADVILPPDQAVAWFHETETSSVGVTVAIGDFSTATQVPYNTESPFESMPNHLHLELGIYNGSYCVDEEGQHHEDYDSFRMVVLNDRIGSKPSCDIFPKYTSMTPQSVGTIISNIKRLNDNHRQDNVSIHWLDIYQDDGADRAIIEATLPFGRNHFIGIKLTFEGRLGQTRRAT